MLSGFELVLLLLLLNFINNIKTYQLLKWKKWSVLLLHFGFIIALVGAFVSRYIGYEGVMLVQENDTSNQIILPSPIFKLQSTTIVFSTVRSNSTISLKCFTKYPKTKFSFPGSEDISVEVTAKF